MLAPVLLVVAQTRLDQILSDPRLNGSVVSATITDLDGHVLYDHNGAQRVVPASNQKLLSNAFALYALGANYKPQTKFWKRGDDLIIQSDGDPLMTYRKLQDAAAQLRTNDWTQVFLREAYAPGIPDSWEIDDLPNKYAAPITAFTVDRGGFELWNENGRLALRPSSYGVRIEAQKSAAPFLRYDPFTRRVTYSGQYPAKTERLDTLALPRPDEAAASIFGHLRGGVDKLPDGPPTLVVDGSTIADTLAECLPPSDNNVAEHLLLMGASKAGPLGVSPYPLARQRLEAFLVNVVGIDKQQIHVFDGSGMSRHDLVTTQAIAKLLVWAAKQDTAPWWRHALAYPGKGTLANRLRGLAFQGKTGSLDMVVALSGYVRSASGDDVVVSVILNDFLCSESDARSIADAFVTEAAKLETKGGWK